MPNVMPKAACACLYLSQRPGANITHTSISALRHLTLQSPTTRPRPAAKACKDDADKFCNVTWFFGYKSGQVIACLRDVKDKVAKPCKAQLFKVMLDVSALGQWGGGAAVAGAPASVGGVGRGGWHEQGHGNGGCVNRGTGMFH